MISHGVATLMRIVIGYPESMENDGGHIILMSSSSILTTFDAAFPCV